MKSSSGKSFTIWSDNPKMNTASQPAIRKYADGGKVIDTRPATQRSRTVYVDEKGQAGPKGTAYEAPVKVNAGRGQQRVVTTPREESWTEYGEGMRYTEYDTSMEPEARAPEVFAGQAPKVSQMRDISKPGDVEYFGDSQKDAATKMNEERWAAYNRRLQNEAIRTGNPMPGTEKPTASNSKIAEEGRQKASNYGSNLRAPVMTQERINQMRADVGEAVKNMPFYENKATAIADLQEALKRRKKKDEA